MTDTYRHKGLRKRLVDALAQRGIKDQAVLAAIGAVPRHFFLDKAFEEHAYEDKPFPIGNEQTISQPYTVAYMTELLEVKRGDRILEIGTGSGYQAAVLAAMGARVFTVERQEALYLSAKKLLAAIGFSSVRCFFRDGSKGMPEYAPYDKIVVTAGAPVVPEPLLQQLRTGGMLIIPVGEDVQYMYRITRLTETEFKEEIFDAFRFVPFLEGVAPKK
ncbi:MAG: protein-L-isoaspartate(D-aspartate) O-methyltransferase [Lewinellaceae bacterium]|nr:protein-L-isoaspartate(D-aspartate) O-methyltransferase [Saprospiraceae bacterium]MCB9316015.1 protein-L-isoaspartate(D-aspartate) O-methyltransferase [Lewinellaceae bacterium]MCB9330057.1 protein-L-isoaspartate(D-aspartate) O-methyltransferase [Lewinellaceae bacterium]